jgi:hypothetical protein
VRILGFLFFVAGLVLSFGHKEILARLYPAKIDVVKVYENRKYINPIIDLNSAENEILLKLLLDYKSIGYDPKGFAIGFSLESTETNLTNFIEYGVIDKFKLLSRSNSTIKYLWDIGAVKKLKGKFEVQVSLWTGDERAYFQQADLQIISIPKGPQYDFPFYGNLTMWLGAAMFVLGLRRRNRVDPSAPPAPSKWGRGS